MSTPIIYSKLSDMFTSPFFTFLNIPKRIILITLALKLASSLIISVDSFFPKFREVFVLPYCTASQRPLAANCLSLRLPEGISFKQKHISEDDYFI